MTKTMTPTLEEAALLSTKEPGGTTVATYPIWMASIIMEVRVSRIVRASNGIIGLEIFTHWGSVKWRLNPYDETDAIRLNDWMSDWQNTYYGTWNWNCTDESCFIW
jgi:hypothetical protein